MVERDRGSETVAVACIDYPQVVVDGGVRDDSWLGFDAGPFDREPVRVEPERRQQGDVVDEMLVMFTCVTGYLTARAGLLPLRPIVFLAAFDLVCRRGRAPDERFGKHKQG